MDNQKLQSALRDALEAEIPSGEVHLWPRVEASLIAGKTQPGEKMNRTKPRLVFAALTVMALLAMALATPQGRAFAQRMFHFFAATDEKSFPLPTEMVQPAPATPTPPPTRLLPLEPAQISQPTQSVTPDATCSAPDSRAGHFCQVKSAEAQAGFDAREFPYDPKGMKFSSAAFVPETGEIGMEFVVITGGGYLYLRQGIGESSLIGEWDKVPEDAIEQVAVNGQYAELVLGVYSVYPNATQAVWEPGGLLRLRWQEGDRWFSLEKVGDPYPIEWITKDEIIKLAESLVDERPLDAVPPLDPEYLSTVEQAEALTGFDIPTPALLPDGYELKRVVWLDNVVRLMYGPKKSSDSELFIFLSQTANEMIGPCKECPPDAIETVQVGPWTGWYWRGGFDGGMYVEGQPTPTPVWVADAPHWSLSWSTDQFWFSIFYSPPFGSGKEIDRETLIKIAESLR